MGVIYSSLLNIDPNLLRVYDLHTAVQTIILQATLKKMPQVCLCSVTSHFIILFYSMFLD